ncbi:MAG: DNA-directed RNA polymerase subunit omega [Clostridia bacterium]|nr:DNA-directed RNA polymerase subunit omega [Clostridia bacterium]
MLSDPNVKKIMPKAGNRYQSALAIAKRARNIENRRVIEGDNCIKDAVDIAAQEIVDGKVLVKFKGEYVCKPEEKAETEITQKEEE